jgi:hypothetical protein
LPSIGGVDFTPDGAKLWRRLSGETSPSSFTDVVHIRTARYFRSKAAALAAIEELSQYNGSIVSTTLPAAIGPWRVQWWRRYPEGYRIDIEEKQQWEGRSGGSEAHCHLSPPQNVGTSPKRLQHILDCHSVTLGEWLVLANVGDDGVFRQSWFDGLAKAQAAPRQGAPPSTSRQSKFGGPGYFGGSKEYRGALQVCLANSWLRLIGSTASDEIVAVFERDPVLAPLGFAGQRAIGEVDFTSCGAALYQMIAAEYWGLDWDAALRVEKPFYRKEHHYCEVEEPLQEVPREYAARRETVLAASDIIPIGPWCVYWWDQFPAGYMLEIEIGDRAPGVDTPGYGAPPLQR